MPACPRRALRLAILFAAVVSCFSLAGCGVLVTWYAAQQANDKGNDDSDFKAQDDALLQDLAQRFGLMALLSEAIYRRDLSRVERDINGCTYLKAGAAASAPEYGMPVGTKGRWKRWVPDQMAKPALPGTPNKVPAACLDDPTGLYYETYVLERQGQLVEAVIAFRGTENRPGQTFRDWRSNVAAFLGFEPAQHAAAREHMIPLIEALSGVLAKPDGKAKIYATGHSLGGGLAQQAGYMSEKIRAVYTFNTSPVTNWSRLRLNGEVRNAYPIFYRIYHGGEFLEKVRFVTTSATSARYGRHDIGLQLKDRSNVAGHSIQLMACELARMVRDSAIDEAPHGYTSEWIRNTLLDDRRDDQPCSAQKAGA
jgi:hypothetical protein